MSQMRLDVPDELNKLLRKYAIDYEKGSREKATIYILEQFLIKLYEMERKND